MHLPLTAEEIADLDATYRRRRAARQAAQVESTEWERLEVWDRVLATLVQRDTTIQNLSGSLEELTEACEPLRQQLLSHRRSDAPAWHRSLSLDVQQIQRLSKALGD